MAQFRAKKLDLGCFVNIKNIRDHTKRKVFEQHEPERLRLDGNAHANAPLTVPSGKRSGT
ncbi:40S ribosomal protein mrp2, mitochondrial [Friedmanniomyces endolithicus]|uniref:40S ribosomal protein mrp2, mitochondrial n=1 Tax=Friedmanniomyces endolithicus TaxID=329885 RepID=A0AAN6FD40_9PEZI|nr:40S ribosomal protein mrp2, mitochondrial [Friedmanniomyces endolithicus]KAK0276597.1 40S ribosomal protein mrp2, mitochondrial [Friedmanniomyces endolithicus]KAK0294165.1 40S ribosomal protein mrp2, mitochondrial [Friedmanniomyces endolithicus]KAK0303380.1 40S ribosomal protein mrp2, mitochondrial [Friedmanniomyces endolithicus]KAK0315118.1 40S ribosomal protein mrp2, mitochondrial [Friedmanniomyces endolithicus]